jgi:hypothetical protein
MPATQPSKKLRALCHEHHMEMRLNQSLLYSEGDAIRTLTYVCTEPDCLVHYNTSRGYLILSQNGNMKEEDAVPSVRCPHDGTPMLSRRNQRGEKGFSPVEMPQMRGDPK